MWEFIIGPNGLDWVDIIIIGFVVFGGLWLVVDVFIIVFTFVFVLPVSLVARAARALWSRPRPRPIRRPPWEAWWARPLTAAEAAVWNRIRPRSIRCAVCGHAAAVRFLCLHRCICDTSPSIEFGPLHCAVCGLHRCRCDDELLRVLVLRVDPPRPAPAAPAPIRCFVCNGRPEAVAEHFGYPCTCDVGLLRVLCGGAGGPDAALRETRPGPPW